MHVAHVIHHYGKLSESFIPDALEELERAGAQGWVGTMSVVHRETYPFPPDERLVVCPPPRAFKRGIDHLRGRSGADRFAGAVSDRLRPHAPAVVHAQFGWASRSGVRVARRLGVPSLVSFHGTDVTTVPVLGGGGGVGGWRGPPGHPYEEAFAHLDVAIAVSEFIAGKLRDLGFGGRVEIVPAGVGLSRLPFRGHEPGGSERRLLYVGRLNAQKGLSVLLRAMPAIAREVPQVRLDVIGGGPDEEALRAQSAHLGLGERVTFHGPLPERADVLEGLRRAHVFVVPSRAMPDGAAEGSPVVTKEAQAVGVPLVATDTGGIAETVPPEHRGDLVPGDDPIALAGRVVALLGDPAARAERAARGRAWVEAEFDSRRLALRTIELYESVEAAR